MEEIANQLMSTKGSLYYYFKSKEEILFFCHEYSLNKVLEVLKGIETSGESPEVKLRKLLINHMRIIMTEPTALVVATQLEPLRGEYREKINAKRDLFEAGLRRILAEGIAKGVFCNYDPKILGFLILGSLNWITIWYSPSGEIDAEQIITSTSEVLLRAVTNEGINTSLLTTLKNFDHELQQCLHANLARLNALINSSEPSTQENLPESTKRT